MTPQERDLITTLFDRLANLESAPRDADADRAIAEGLARAPHAVYPLVQTVLVQDEALKAANARIEELEAGLGESAPSQPQGSFLGTMRDSLFGRQEPPRAGSVPSVRPGGSPWANAPGYRDEGPAAPMMPGAPMMGAPSGYGGGGSFLGTAAATAAGMIGGSLLLGGIRNMLGGHRQGAFGGTFDQLSGGRGEGGGQGSGELSRQAGLDDIGRSPTAGGEAAQGRAGLFGGSDADHDEHDTDADDQDSDGDDGDFGDGGSDDGSDYA
ncbi:MAG TPA: DUF2076 domain-containing protein [Xanthobacteraceae bacterium]|nr:DUF2076 domain-containing protein [Xanthobacteraceae bacterium]